MKKWIASVLSALMLLSVLVGCQQTTPDHPETGESTTVGSDTTADSESGTESDATTDVGTGVLGEDYEFGPDELALVKDGTSQYTIVRSDINSEIGVDAAIFMRKYLKECGVELNIVTDWEDKDVTEYEIVIGDTKRTAEQGNTQSSKTVKTGEYYITVAGNRIYIGGASNDAVMTAVKIFLKEYFGYDRGDVEAPRALNVGLAKDYSKQEPYYRMDAYFKGQNVLDRRVFVLNKQVNTVSIVTGDDPAEIFAGEELGKYLSMIGVSEGESNVTISLNIDPDLMDDAYKIQIKRNKVIITGGNARGVIYGAYGLLTHYAGMAFYTGDVEYLGSGDVVLSESYEYTPVFETRMADWYVARHSASWNVKNGINANVMCKYEDNMGGKVSYGKYFVHNICAVTNTDPNAQPCLTDPAILDYAIKFVRNRLETEPDVQIITVSQMDNQNYCKCANCAAVDEEEGSPSGTLLRFINAIAADIADEYPDVVIDTLAYLYTRKPPKITKPLPNVCIRLCSIECCFTHALDDPSCEQNVAFCNDIKGWSEICNRIYVWDYGANFANYIPPFPNFEVMRQNMRFFADYNVKGMFVQGIYCPSGEFGDLKNYLLAQLMLDPYMSRETYYKLMDGFLEAYYGAGWKYIRAYIDMVMAETTGCLLALDDPYSGMPLETFARYEEIFDEWWNKAEELAGDRVENVKHSRLQWRYVKLSLHPNKQDAQEFIRDVQLWGTDWGDAVGTAVPERANLELGPEWWYIQHTWLPE